MNKYQKIFNEYQVRDEVKEKIYEKLNSKKSFKLSYAIIILGVIGLVSLTSVYAEEISAFFKSWTKDQASQNIPEETDVNVMSKITNFDDTKLERYIDQEGIYNTVDIESDYLDIFEVEKEIGVKLLKYKDRKASYRLDGTNNKDGYVSRIGIGYETIYKDRDDSEFASQYEQHVKQKTVELSAAIYTKNFDDDALLTDYWFGDVAEMDWKNNYQKVVLENLGVTAIYYDVGPTYLEEDTKGIGHSKTNELYFVYDGITYSLVGKNMEMEDFLSFAKELTV